MDKVERYIFAVLLKHACLLEKAIGYAHKLYTKHKTTDIKFPKVSNVTVAPFLISYS